MLSPAAAAAKWASRMQSSGEQMKAGVQSMTVSPTELAANAKDRWEAGVRRAAQEGTFEQGCRSVSLQSWQSDYINKGIPAAQNAARIAQPKVQAFLADFLPYAAQVSAEVAQMPKGTLADSIARSTAAITKLSQYRKRR